MDILFVCDTMGPGGAERVISVLSNSFSSSNCNVSILMIGKNANGSFYDLNENIDIINLGNDSSSYLSRIKAIKKEVLRKHPSIVISFLSYVCIYVWLALMHTQIPYIVSERNDPNHRRKFRQFLLNKAFKKAKGCVFQTEDALKWYGAKFVNKSVVIYNPVRLDYYVYNLSETKKQILYVGRLTTQKNCSMLIDSFSFFCKNHPDYIFKIYGSGPNAISLKKQVDEYGLQNKVFILQNSKTWQKDEFNSAMFVLGSAFEGMPNVLSEALCLGIPCVSTDCTIGGPKELKKIFKERLVLSKSSSPQDFAFAMEECIRIPRIISKIPVELSEKTVSNKWMLFIKKMIGEK